MSQYDIIDGCNANLTYSNVEHNDKKTVWLCSWLSEEPKVSLMQSHITTPEAKIHCFTSTRRRFVTDKKNILIFSIRRIVGCESAEFFVFYTVTFVPRVTGLECAYYLSVHASPEFDPIPLSLIILPLVCKTAPYRHCHPKIPLCQSRFPELFDIYETCSIPDLFSHFKRRWWCVKRAFFNFSYNKSVKGTPTGPQIKCYYIENWLSPSSCYGLYSSVGLHKTQRQV